MTFKELPVGSYFQFADSTPMIKNGTPKSTIIYRKLLLVDNLPSDIGYDENEHCFILNDDNGRITKVMPSHMEEKISWSIS